MKEYVIYVTKRNRRRGDGEVGEGGSIYIYILKNEQSQCLP